MKKNQIFLMHKDEKDFQLIKNYYLNFLKQIKDPLNHQKYEEELFYVEINYNNKTYLRKMSKNTMIQIFGNYADYSTLMNQWVKIYDCFPREVLYNDYRLKAFNRDSDMKAQIDIVKKKLENQIYKIQDFIKPTDKLPQIQEKKQEKIKQKQFNSQKCELLLTSIVQFLEQKLQQKVVKLHLCVIVDQNNTIWLLDANNIKIMNDQTLQLEDLNIDNVPKTKQVIQTFEKNCKGVYCKYDKFFFNEEINDTNFIGNSYINNIKKDNWEINNIITKKSTILDFLEREKAIKRVQDVANLTREQTLQLGENFLFNIRQFLNLANLHKTDYKYLHQTHNIYQNIYLCKNCQNIYFTIDKLRNQDIYKKYSDEELLDMIKKQQKNNTSKSQVAKKLFSQDKEQNINQVNSSQSYKMLIKTQSLFQLDEVKQINFQDKIINYEQKPKYVLLIYKKHPIIQKTQYLSQDGEIFKIKNRISKDFAENISIRQARYSNRFMNNNDDIDDEILFYNKQLQIKLLEQKNQEYQSNPHTFQEIVKKAQLDKTNLEKKYGTILKKKYDDSKKVKSIMRHSNLDQQVKRFSQLNVEYIAKLREQYPQN